jgi:hypothetical protein
MLVKACNFSVQFSGDCWKTLTVPLGFLTTNWLPQSIEYDTKFPFSRTLARESMLAIPPGLFHTVLYTFTSPIILVVIPSVQ